MVENRLERPYTLLVGECLAEILVLPYFCGELVAVPVSLPGLGTNTPITTGEEENRGHGGVDESE